MQTRSRDLILRIAETQFDAALVGLDYVDALEQPEHYQYRRNKDEYATIEPTGYDIAKPVLATPDDILKVGRPAPATAATAWAIGPLPPWSLIVTAAAAPRAAAAILIAPGHQNLVIR